MQVDKSLFVVFDILIIDVKKIDIDHKTEKYM